MATAQLSLTARRFVDEVKSCGITHAVWLPDSEARFLYDTMTADPDLAVVPVCREGETFAIAMGLIIGGKTPVVLIQNTGFFESGDSIRALALDCELPLLVLVGYRGWRQGRPMTDSAGVYTVKNLESWGIEHYLVESDSDVGLISEAFRRAQDQSRPVAVLIGTEYE